MKNCGFPYTRHISLVGRSILVLCGILAPFVILWAGQTGPAAHRKETGPHIYLQDHQPVRTTYKGNADAVQALSSQAAPLAATSADFDEDGIGDLAVAYSAPAGGLIAIHKGNLDAFAPQSQESWRAIGEGRFPPPFIEQARVFSTSVTPDFLASGEFLGSGHADLVTAARSGNTLSIFPGDGRGGFGPPKTVLLRGSVTAVASGSFGLPSKFTGLLVAIEGAKTSSILVFTGSENGLVLNKSVSMPASASSIVLGDVDGDSLPDAVIVGGGQVLVLHSGEVASGTRLETLVLPLSASNVALGRFVFDRDPRLQMAILARDGSVNIAARAGIDSRPWTAEEVAAMRAQRGKPKNIQRRKALPPYEGWKIIETFTGVSPFSDNVRPPLLLRTRISGHGSDDVMVLNREAQHMVVVAHPNGEPGVSAFKPGEVSVRSYTTGAPVVALPMRVNIDARPGLIVLHQDSPTPRVMMPLPDPTFWVNRFDDPPPGVTANNCNNTSNTDTSSSCSLRQAVIKANTTAGPDTIMVPAGTITLTIPSQDTADASTGHLDVLDSLSIVGPGASTTIIQTCNLPQPPAACGNIALNQIDKVFSFNPNGSVNSFDMSLTGVTIQFGRNSSGVNPFGGAFDWDAGIQGTGTLSITNCNIVSNSAVINPSFPSADGGGMFLSNIAASGTGANTGSVSISGSLIGSNTAEDIGGGIADDGFVPLTLTNTQIASNQAIGGGNQQGGGLLVFGPSGASATAIHNTVITGNHAGSSGGGIFTTAGLVIDQTTTIANNVSGGNGGGVWANMSGETTTISVATLTGNTASGNGGAIHVDSNAAGNNLTVQFSRIVGNTATAGSGVDNGSGTVSASNNWWGCNGGPAVSPCDGTNGSVSLQNANKQDAWITFNNAFGASRINVNDTATVTAGVLQDNNNNPLPASNLGALFNLPATGSIFGNVNNGKLSNVQNQIQSNGQATATFTATAAGTGSVSASLDQATVTAAVAISSFSISATPTSQPVNAGASATYTVSVTPTNGFTNNVTLSASGLPPNTPPPTFSVNPIPGGSGSSNMTITPPVGTVPNSYTITVQGTADNPGALVKTTQVTLVVNAPAVTLSPSSLTFANQNVGTSSAAQTVTLNNAGTLALSINSLTAGGDFAQTNNCGSTVAANASCSINVTFTPSATGARTGTLSLSDNAAGSPQSVSLTGTGNSVVLLPTTLNFGSQAVGTTSAAQTLTLTNNSTSTLTISSITPSGDFGQTNNCGSTLAAGGNCTINVTFTPTATGSRSGTLSVTDNGVGSPRTASLGGTGVSPVANLSPTSLSLGNQNVGTISAAQTLTLSNTGTVPLTITSITSSGDFAQSNNCPSSPASLAAGASCAIQVTFKPTANGSRSGTVTVTDNGVGSPRTASLSGTGTAPVASLSPTSLSFGNQNVGTTSAAQTVTLSNTGTGPLTITSPIAVSGDFAQSNNCPSSPATLAAGASCAIQVTFKPTATGSRSGTLSVGDDAAGSPQTASLSGTGTVPSLTPTSLTFGNQNVGTTSAAQTVTLSNPGAGPLTINSITTSGDFAPQSNNCGSSLAGGASCTIQVTFTPTVTGSRSGTLSVSDNAAGSPETASLSGTGTAPVVSLSPTTGLSFGNQNVGTTSPPQTVTLSNTGTGPLTITSITTSGDFAQSNNCGSSLAAGANCTISVTFTPKATGSRSGILSVSDNAAGSPQTVGLTGTGTLPGASLSPTSVSFGNQQVATTSAAQTVTLNSSGTGPLTISSIASTGDFAQSNNCGSSLAAGASCTISVTFTPSATGLQSGTVSVTDNAAGSPQTASLSGTGTPPAASLSPTSLSFGNQLVGTTSAAQTVTLSNTGTGPVTISSITTSGDFAQSNNCGSSLAAGANCTIQVTFTPTAAGSRSGALSVTDNAAGSPHSASLSGTASNPVPSDSVSPSVYGFGDFLQTDPPRSATVTVTNTGLPPISFGSISVGGPPFSVSGTSCGSSLAAGASCTITVTFDPSNAVPGTNQDTLTISSNVPGSPQTVALTGTLLCPRGGCL